MEPAIFRCAEQSVCTNEKLDKNHIYEVTQRINNSLHFKFGMTDLQDRMIFTACAHINNYHSKLKKFLKMFNGVSSKYLDNYLVWNNLINCSKKTDSEKRNTLLLLSLTAPISNRCRTLSTRPAIPIVV